MDTLKSILIIVAGIGFLIAYTFGIRVWPRKRHTKDPPKTFTSLLKDDNSIEILRSRIPVQRFSRNMLRGVYVTMQETFAGDTLMIRFVSEVETVTFSEDEIDLSTLFDQLSVLLEVDQVFIKAMRAWTDRVVVQLWPTVPSVPS